MRKGKTKTFFFAFNVKKCTIRKNKFYIILSRMRILL